MKIKGKEKLVISDSFITFDDGVAAYDVVVVMESFTDSYFFLFVNCAITFI